MLREDTGGGVGTFVSWIRWHGPFRTRGAFWRAIVKAESKDSPLREGARLYIAAGRQKRLSLADPQILYIGQNSLSAMTLSDRAIKSLFEEKKIRGWFNEYWYGVIQNSFYRIDEEPDGARVVDQTECALIYFSNPLRNKECVFLGKPFSFRIMSEFQKPWHETILPTALERLLPKLIDYEHESSAPAFRWGSFSYRLTWRKKAIIENRRPNKDRDREDTDCWRQRIAVDEPTDAEQLSRSRV